MKFTRDGQTVVVNKVPADLCENCGEAYVTEHVTAQVLEIVAHAREADTNGALGHRRPVVAASLRAQG